MAPDTITVTVSLTGDERKALEIALEEAALRDSCRVQSDPHLKSLVRKLNKAFALRVFI